MHISDAKLSNLAESADSVESFCIRVETKVIRELVIEIFKSPGEDIDQIFMSLFIRHKRVQPELLVNLLDRRHRNTSKEAWQHYVDLYKSRLLGVNDESSSDD
jgi:hypothetical protein